MRIAVYHNLPAGGAMRVLGVQCRELIARGHTLECWMPAGAATAGLPATMPLHVVPFRGIWGWLQRLSPALMRQFQKTTGSIGALDDIARRAAAAINQGAFDVLFSGNCRYQAVPPIGRHVDIPSVLYAHEPYRPFHEPELAMPLTRLNRRRRIRAEVENATAFTLLLANSAYSRDRLHAVYGRIPRVCYLGVDTTQFRPTGDPRGNAVLGVGVVQPHKRIELAIEALARLPEATRPPLQWVGGRGNPFYRRRLLRLAHRRGVALEFRHQTSDAELVSLLSRARLLICTARNEPFGLTPLEASACGTTVVGVLEGGLMETVVLDVNGVLTDPTPQALVEELRAVLQKPKALDSMGRLARRHVIQRWGLEASIVKLEDYLSEAAAALANGTVSDGDIL